MDEACHDKLLVLDLDETLIHARGPREPPLPWPAHKRVGPFDLYLRPGVHAFLHAVLERFAAVGVWTSATADYAAIMLARLVDTDSLRFVYTRDRCTRRRDLEAREVFWLKDICELAGFGFPRHRVIFVDDKPRGLERSTGNLVRVRPYFGDPEDDELERLLPYLDAIGAAEDVRTIEKRAWRTPPGSSA